MLLVTKASVTSGDTLIFMLKLKAFLFELTQLFVCQFVLKMLIPGKRTLRFPLLFI